MRGEVKTHTVDEMDWSHLIFLSISPMQNSRALWLCVTPGAEKPREMPA